MDPALTSETHFKDLFAFLHKLYKAKSLCDFYIHAQDGVVCPVHKIVVAASSLYIYQMIASCPEMTQISLDISSEILQTLIDFIYTGELLASEQTWTDVQKAADFLQIRNVVDLMQDHKANDSLPAGTTLANEISTTDIKDEPCSSKEVHTDHKSIKTDGKKVKDASNNRNKTIKAKKGKLQSRKHVVSHTIDPESHNLPRLRQNIRKNCAGMYVESRVNHFPETGNKKQLYKKGRKRASKSREMRRKYKKHVNKFERELRYKCLYCDTTFKFLFKRHNHMCHFHKERYLKYLFSSFLCKRTKYLKVGIGLCICATGARKFIVCKLCNKKFHRYSLFIYHYGRKHQWKFQQKWFNYVHKRSFRNRKLSAKKEFECAKCQKTFISEFNLAVHLERYHSQDMDEYQQTFLTLLQQLKAKRSGRTCKICGKHYHFQSSLWRHMALHTQEKPHQCATCGKTFTLKSGLKEHSAVHDKDKICICAICGKCYKHRQSLRRHMTEHDPNRTTYNCVTCGKTFDRQDKFMAHSRSHTQSQSLDKHPRNLDTLNHNYPPLKDGVDPSAYLYLPNFSGFS